MPNKREIKFRVRDLETSKLYQPEEICRLHFNEGILSAVLLWDESLILKPQLLEYIGLKDESKVEIYEEDILEDHFWNSRWFTVNRVVRIPDIYEVLGGHRWREGSYYKVIGTLLENPELLNTKKRKQ